MSSGASPTDLHAIVDYVRARILPLAPAREPIPFRGRVDLAADSLPFFDDLDTALRTTPGAIWNIMGPPGCGKTSFAQWAAAQWGQRFLQQPEDSPAPLWIGGERLEAALADDRSLTGGPFAFALALAPDLPGESPESLARLFMKRQFIAIIDKEAAADSTWKLQLPMGLPPGFKILHVAVKDSLGGPCVRLDYWDFETALLAAHRRRGPDGARLIEALATGPTGSLAAFPWFVTWLLDRHDATAEFAASPACVEEFLRHVWSARAGGRSFEKWCRHLLLNGDAGAATKLTQTMESHLVLHALKATAGVEVLARHRLGEEELNALRRQSQGQKILTGSQLVKLVRAARTNTVALTNAINICWLVGRQRLPRRALTGELTGVILPGHQFHKGLAGVKLRSSNLDGVSTARPFHNCEFFDSTFREASFAGVRFSHCSFDNCIFELADFSGARFESCAFNGSNLADGIWSAASFDACSFSDGTVLASTQEGEAQRFLKCEFTGTDLSRLVATGLDVEECRFYNISLAGLTIPTLKARGAMFERCDLIGCQAPGAELVRAKFFDCLLADANLQGADLHLACFTRVEFQPGPASRAGMTDEMTRTDPLHGSKSGFYAEDLADGIYLDPDLVRTADLRNTDLRAATFPHTDLFRVDLRGAQLEPELLEKAQALRAILE